MDLPGTFSGDTFESANGCDGKWSILTDSIVVFHHESLSIGKLSQLISKELSTKIKSNTIQHVFIVRSLVIK